MDTSFGESTSALRLVDFRHWTFFIMPGARVTMESGEQSHSMSEVACASQARAYWTVQRRCSASRHGFTSQDMDPRHSMYAIYAYIDPQNHPN